MRADSHTHQFDEYADIRRGEQLEREAQAECEQWTKNNAAIHAMTNGLPDVWHRAFHTFITTSFKAKQWNDLTSDQLAMCRKRLEQQTDALAWVKEKAKAHLAAPAWQSDADGLTACRSLVKQIVDASAFDAAFDALAKEVGATGGGHLGSIHIDKLWVELARRDDEAPNGGQGGELSERELWIMQCVNKHAAPTKPDGHTHTFSDDEIPF